MRKLLNKTVAGALLASFVNFSFAPAFADTTILGGGAKGGVITDLGGAEIMQNKANNAKIGITGNGNVIKWDSLNVGAGKTLDFNFSKAGQVALNKVTGGSMSTIAGTLSTSGAAGKLILSNPAGMIFADGAHINVNSAIFTTKDVIWDGLLNGKLELRDVLGGTSASITVKKATFKVADDLNIVAPSISIGKNADIMADKNVRLLTTDGVTFVMDSVTTSMNDGASAGSVSINGARQVAVKDNAGRVYITSGDVEVINKAKVKNAEVSAKNVNVDDSNVEKSSVVASATVTVKNNATLEKTTVDANNVDVTKRAKVRNSSVSANEFNANDATVEKSSVVAESVDVVNNTEFREATVLAEDFTADKAKINNSSVTANTLENAIKNSTLTDVSLSSSEGSIIMDAVDKNTFKGTKLTLDSAENISLTDAKMDFGKKGTLTLTAENDVVISGGDVKGSVVADASNVSVSSAKISGDFNTDSVKGVTSVENSNIANKNTSYTEGTPIVPPTTGEETPGTETPSTGDNTPGTTTPGSEETPTTGDDNTGSTTGTETPSTGEEVASGDDNTGSSASEDVTTPSVPAEEVVETPSTPAEEVVETPASSVIAEAVVSEVVDNTSVQAQEVKYDLEKSKYGNALDSVVSTKFQKQFTTRGFAASFDSDDEVLNQKMKSACKSAIKNEVKNSIILKEKFIAY